MPEIKDVGSAKTTLDGTEIVAIQEAAGGVNSAKHATVTNLPGGGGNFPVAQASVTNLTTDLSALQTQTAVQAAQIAARQRANGLDVTTGPWYVGNGCALSASGTAGKLAISAGMAIIGKTDLAVAAASAITGTDSAHDDITEMANATNPKWVAVELDSSGGINYNMGTAAASPSIPTFTADRVPLGLLYIPAAATNSTGIDTLLTTNNGKCKLIDIRELSGAPVTGWQYDSDTWVYVSGTSFKVTGKDVTAKLAPGTRVSYNDGATDYGVIATSTFSTDTTVTLIGTDDYSIANATLTQPRYSYEEKPQSFPAVFTWSPTLSGWGPNPSNGATLTSVSTTIATSKFNKTSHGLANGQPISLSGVSTTTGVTNNTVTYYVVNQTANDFQVSTTLGGSAVTLGGTTDAAITVSLIGLYRWWTIGRRWFYEIRQQTAGTSTSATHTATMPTNLTAATVTNMTWGTGGSGVDNNVGKPAFSFISSAGTTITLNSDLVVANTASGVSRYSVGNGWCQF